VGSSVASQAPLKSLQASAKASVSPLSQTNISTSGSSSSAVASITPASVSSNPPTTNILGFGANLEGVKDWSRSNVFVDLVKQSRPFGPPDAPYDSKNLVPVNSEGWPIQDFGVVLQNGLVVPGVYQFRFIGKAESITMLATPSSKYIVKMNHKMPENVTSGTLEIKEELDKLSLKFLGTFRGVSKLQVLRPGYSFNSNETDWLSDKVKIPIFTTQFLDHVKRFNLFRFIF
jgi:hypothetical protein